MSSIFSISINDSYTETKEKIKEYLLNPKKLLYFPRDPSRAAFSFSLEGKTQVSDIKVQLKRIVGIYAHIPELSNTNINIVVVRHIPPPPPPPTMNKSE